MSDVLDVILSMLVGTIGTILFVAWDERRLSPDAAQRAWPISTRLSAALAFGPFCLPVHFFRTRRSLWGTLLGFVATALLLATAVALSALVHLVCDP